MPPILLATALLAALSAGAKVTSVTVFNDRARVVREADLELHGPVNVELALLPDSVEPDSIRLELSGAKGARVQKVDLAHLDTDAFPEADARKLLDQLDEADDRLALAAREHRALHAQLEALQGLHPVFPQPDLRGPAPKLNASGWSQVLAFLSNSSERLQARLRDVSARIEQLQRERQKLAAEARVLGASHRRTGLQVTAQLTGEGAVHATLTYMVGSTRWRPSWTLTYRPPGASASGAESVQAQLDGLVWQATGEPWSRPTLSLSTAVPGTMSALPELLSWRIGEKERFAPSSHAVNPPPFTPPPPWTQPEDESSATSMRDQLRARLLERAAVPEPEEASAADADGPEGAIGEEEKAGAIDRKTALKPGSAPRSIMPPPPPAIAAAPRSVSKEKMSLVPYGKSARNFDAVLTTVPGAQTDSYGTALNGSGSPDRNYIIDGVQVNDPGLASATYGQLGLAPPPAWTAPTFDADSPAAFAGGFDLSFTAANPVTLESGSAARRVPLFAESWPVHTERLVYPALAQQAWLVAKLKVPSERTLPGGDAELFVGADPAGHARLQAMAPGEEIALPLGIDRAIKPVRNVSQVQSEKGLFAKDDVDEYAVTIELANPYSRPIALRVFDQLPLKGNDIVDVELVSASPAVMPNGDSGQLEWAFELPAAQKTLLTFSYRLRRPHGARLHQ